jgi:aminopeptidase N
MEISAKPQKIYLKDYQAPDFSVEKLELDFILNEESTYLHATSQFQRRTSSPDLFLDGEDLELVSISIDGQKPRYELKPQGLMLYGVPDRFELKIQTRLKPQANTSLEGLYQSNGVFCTQCEPQGFRKMTYFMDRPDVMTKFKVRVEADEKKYPVLLSNGNRLSKQKLPKGRHEAIWEDPFKKPSYLFALVAGDLGVIRDTFTTASGKKVDLEIYAAHGKQERCHFAMQSLKKSMKWDEQRFGREYDLSTYMILAVDDFNAGAMENKGLNIFNSRLVFADSKTATDSDYFDIEAVIAHEYFHNWTGNRVTLRDWFHLSLKEGLTVFRDQEFSMDQSSRDSIRIEGVNDLRNSQFAEDAGPNAHPIRPASCYSVDNFFTSTIYEKGSEVIRMMQTMVGRPGFRKGMDAYFELHDGQAVVIEDFAQAIAKPNSQNWEQFKLWYSQAGTPIVHVSEVYDADKKTYSLKLTQDCPPTPQEKIGKLEKKPFHIPLILGLLDSKTGQEIPLKSSQAVVNTDGQTLVHLKKQQETFQFENVPAKPILSLNRQFSAPIHLDWKASFEELLFLMRFDSDAFNRWEAAQKIYLKVFQVLIQEIKQGKSASVDSNIIDAFLSVVENSKLDPDLKAKLMDLPDFKYLAQMEPILDSAAFLKARELIKTSFAKRSEAQLLAIYKEFHGVNITSLDPKDFGRRRLKNLALDYMSFLPSHHKQVWDQFEAAQIMTDHEAAFAMLVGMENNLRKDAIQLYFERWKSESLVLNRWFSIQASSDHPETFQTVQKLWSHPEFNIKNPNRVRALLGAFGNNISQFHRSDLETYSFMADRILELDKLNPQVAARVAGCFGVWTKLPDLGKKKVHRELEKLVRSGLSKNTLEIIQKALEASTSH